MSLAIVVIFGIIHGLGIASALIQLGVDDEQRLVGLLAFNIDVELERVLFILPSS